MTVAGLVLAAGGGRRMGGPKALVRLGGELLVARVHRTLEEGGCAPVVVVLGAGATEVQAVAPLAGAEVVVHGGWEAGLGSSLVAGLAALRDRPEITAAVVALADQPWVKPASVARLRAAHDRDGASVAVATYDGRRRNPVLLARQHWADVTGTGDVGARDLARSAEAVEVAVEGDPTDLDTPEDLARAEVTLTARRAPRADPARTT